MKDGRLIPIVVCAPERIKELPDVPTFKEVGVPALSRMPHFGILGPKGMPRDVVDKIKAVSTNSSDVPLVDVRILSGPRVFHAAVRNAMNTPEARERFVSLGVEAAPTQPEELRKWVEDALKHWGPVIRDSGYVLQ